MKKKFMGILSVLPASLFIIQFIIMKIAGVMAAAPKYGGEAPQWYGNVLWVSIIFSAAAMITYIAAIIVFFVYNFKNLYIPHDKKIGWGYMIVCIGAVAMPAYWYNFIRDKRF